MTKLSSADLRKRIIKAGIRYLPADQVFYRDYPYKVELSPKFKGLGGVSGKRGCQIDIADPVKARARLAEFNDMMEKIITNVEYRQEIRKYVARLPSVEFKTRMGGDNNLFYFRDPEVVMLVVERYNDVINSVTGPFNDNHKNTLEESSVVMRNRLYFNRFRYYIEFDREEKFVSDIAPKVLEYLKDLPSSTWRDYKLRSIIQFYYDNGYVNPSSSATSSVRWGPMRNARVKPTFPARSVNIYLSDYQDYVFIKLLASEHIRSNHELVLFDELT